MRLSNQSVAGVFTLANAKQTICQELGCSLRDVEFIRGTDVRQWIRGTFNNQFSSKYYLS